MEPEERAINLTLEEFLEKYDIEWMDTPFKEWFQRAVEQEFGGDWATKAVYSMKESIKKSSKTILFKVGDLVKRKSTISSGVTGIITRVDDIISDKSHGKKYLVIFQQDGNQVWLNADQIEPVE